MRFSTRSRYGTRLMIELAKKYENGPVELRKIAEIQGISEKYLGQIIIKLKAKKLVSSYRGAHGGYYLLKPPKDITLLEIVECLEAHDLISDCIKNMNSCKRSEDCFARDVWKGLNFKIEEYLENVTLQDLLEKNIDIL